MRIDFEHKNSAGPLEGIRVLEFGTNFTAPLSAMWLGDQGADVIKIEAPAGDPTRYASAYREDVTGMASMFTTSNRNKRAMMLDMKRDGAQEIVLRLVKDMDVVIQNFRPGVMERLGFGYEALRALRKDLIFVSISGFGETGPYSEQRAYDPILQGISGMMSVQRDPDTLVPSHVRNAAVDKITALTIFQAVTAALFVRERTGKGQHVRVNMLNAALSFLWPDSMVDQTWLGGKVKTLGGYKDARLVYQSQDGHFVLGGGVDAEWRATCTAAGRPELITDPRFLTLSDRIANFGPMYQELKDCFKNKTTAEWLEILKSHDCVCGPLNTEDMIPEDPQVVAANLLIKTDHPHAGAYNQPIHAAYFEETPASLRRHAPMLGEHTEEILREFGYGEESIENFRSSGAIR